MKYANNYIAHWSNENMYQVHNKGKDKLSSENEKKVYPSVQ